MLTALLMLAACRGPSTPVPEIDTAGMEPLVAEKIGSIRAEVAADQGSAAAWGRLGMVCQAHSLYEDAVAAYAGAEELAPGDYRWPYLAALALLKYDPAAAAEPFARAAELSPEEPAFWIAFGDTLTELGRLEEGVERYQRALALAPDSSHALYGRARVAVARQDLDAAREDLERAAATAPHHGEVHGLLAQVTFRQGDAESAAREELLAALYPDPTRAFDPVVAAMEAEAVSSRSYTQRGLELVEQERFAEAEAVFREVLAIRPGNARDHANLGGAMARQGRIDEALAEYRRALALDPEDPYSRNNLALALADRGQVDPAIGHLERAIAADPTYAEARHNLGLLRARQGRIEAAIVSYREALRLAPAAVAVHTDLGTALASRGRIQEAIESWRRAVDLDPGNLTALYNLSVALATRGDHGEAIALLRAGLARAPNSSRLVSLLAWELATAPEAALRDGAEAVTLAQRVFDAYPGDPAAADVLAAALAESGDYAAATEMAERAAELASGARPAQAAVFRGRLEQYRRQQPFRQPR